jgi:RNA polymerase sigma-70 factor (ECF subfamily)
MSLDAPEPEKDAAVTSANDITQCLARWSDGQAHAEAELMRLVLPEMRKLAQRAFRRERQNHTLQPTALINEAYLQLIGSRTVRWRDRAHFFAMCARIMRHILVDHARRRLRAKREGAAAFVSLDDVDPQMVETPDQLLALSEALDEFAKIDARKARVVEMRFFGGLSVEETAAILEVSPNTIIRDWSLARAWLLRQMNPGADASAQTNADP